MKFEVRVKENKIMLFTEYSMKDICKAIPGSRWNPANRCWQYPATATAARQILDAFKPSNGSADPLHEIIKAEKEKEKNVSAIKKAEELPQPEGIKTPLWLHQKKSVALANRLDGSMLSLDMACGKSLCAVSVIASNDYMRLSFIACPKSVQAGWVKQFETHCINQPMVHVLKGSTADKKAQAEKLVMIATATNKKLVLICNYESTFRTPLADYLLAIKWDLVVADESHRLKSPGGRTSKFFQKLGKQARKRMCLTGTPLPNSILDIYGQYRFACPEVFGTSLTAMRTEYCVMGGYQKHEVVAYRNQEEFTQKMYSRAFRVMANEVLDLPPVLHIERPVELSDKCMAIYKQLKKNLIAEWEQGTITASNGLVKLLRLSQITGGWATTDEGSLEHVDTEKIDSLAEMLEDIAIDEPVVIFARFTQDIRSIKNIVTAAGRSCGELSGQWNDLSDYQSGKVKTLVVQIQSGGVGVELQHCGDKNTKYCVFYSVSYSLAEFEQAKARVHRPGQKETVNYIHIKATGTIDEIIYKCLADKKDTIESFLTELKGEA